VHSAQNKADVLTRVPQWWLTKKVETVHQCCTAYQNDIKKCHEQHHFGVDRTLFLVRRTYPEKAFIREDVASIVDSCIQCRSIDPAPVTFDHGKLSVEESWWRIACDVTHYRSKKYLTVIDCGPSRFAIWRELSNETEDQVVRNLSQIFMERGPPRELLLDNSATFRSAEVKRLCEAWGVKLLFRCAYRPEGNGIAERIHRTIKRMAARSNGDVLQMVFWYNMSPRKGLDEKSVPHRAIYTYEWKAPNIVSESESRGPPHFMVGQKVVVKPPDGRCTTTWTEGVVTSVGDSVSVEVDGIPRHVGDVRSLPIRHTTDNPESSVISERQNDDCEQREEAEGDGKWATSAYKKAPSISGRL
jgi:hypothetical protein